ncbi:MAG TPA: lysophospholipid acyltransferase family protein [Stellaceae bacterium]|jgi:1-acyl-sn-glycerol-3-phosphate acyltransferase|nr:lysophospholipid acyltransferase family protein [Stellaceae bacterium]
MRAFLLRSSRISVYLGVTLSLIGVQALLLAMRSPLAAELPRLYHRLCCRILGFRIVTSGAPSERRPTLSVVNHVSYTDITILGALIRGSFIAKSEVARWPLFGVLAKLQRTVFIERRAHRMAAQRGAIASRLASGDGLILFPEGTSSDGNRVLPFKSALFSAAESTAGEAPVVVQPVSIAYVRLNGVPMGRLYRPFFAWYGDMEMAPHLWTLLGFGIVTVSVEFHEPVLASAFPSRKALAAHCRNVIAEGVARALSGREQGVAAPALSRGESVAPTAIAAAQA